MKTDNILKKIKDEITLENVLSLAIKTPGVRINRDTFLRKELTKHCQEDVITEAIRYNPAKAGISKNVINKIAKSVINTETQKVSGASFIASLPSSANIVATFGAVSVDITFYFAHILRVVQELAYLYGFPQFDLKKDNIDSETMEWLMPFVGVMFGVQEATKGLTMLADTMAKQASKKLAKKALTKGTIYPIIKQISAKIGIRMTKQVFADAVASSIPILGGVASGGLTWVMFKPRCERLQKTLMAYNLCDPDYYRMAADVDGTEVHEESKIE